MYTVISSQFASLPPCGRTCCTVKHWHLVEHNKIDVLIISALVSGSHCSVSFCSAVRIFYCRLYFKRWQLPRVVFLFDLSCVRNPGREKKKIPAMNHNLATLAKANPAIFRSGPFCPSYYWTKQVDESWRRPPIRFITCPSLCLFFYFYPCAWILGLWRQEKGHYSTIELLARTVWLWMSSPRAKEEVTSPPGEPACWIMVALSLRCEAMTRAFFAGVNYCNPSLQPWVYLENVLRATSSPRLRSLSDPVGIYTRAHARLHVCSENRCKGFSCNPRLSQVTSDLSRREFNRVVVLIQQHRIYEATDVLRDTNGFHWHWR